MTIEIPRPLIEYILLGSGDSRRQLQDSPILGDVWVRYTEQPKAAADLLITSHKDTNARELAMAIYEGSKNGRAAGRTTIPRSRRYRPSSRPGCTSRSC